MRRMVATRDSNSIGLASNSSQPVAMAFWRSLATAYADMPDQAPALRPCTPKRANRSLRKLKTYLGRIVRNIERHTGDRITALSNNPLCHFFGFYHRAQFLVELLDDGARNSSRRR
jgi:hypothetical protein